VIKFFSIYKNSKNNFFSDIDKLLGERIVREISVQTGLDLTFELTAEILESMIFTPI
jgi:hypothetical protein